MDFERIKLVLKYIALIAGEADEFFQRSLSAIHFIKYTYLADLAHAEKNRGETYSGINWRFHHYGPWSPELSQQIKPTLVEAGAIMSQFPSTKFDNDLVRWRLHDDQLRREIEPQLPVSFKYKLKKQIQELGNDTSGLLHLTYTTRPMLLAAPGEILDFTPVEREPKEFQQVAEIPVKELSKTAKKKLELKEEQKNRELKERIQTKLESKKAKKRRSAKYTQPRYDDVYFEGLEWLDSLAGPQIEEQEGELEISDSIWKSPGRLDVS